MWGRVSGDGRGREKAIIESCQGGYIDERERPLTTVSVDIEEAFRTPELEDKAGLCDSDNTLGASVPRRKERFINELE